MQGKGLSKSYGVDKIFENIDFVVKEGEKVGLVGHNGAGKTTLFKCLTGSESFDNGEVMISNKYKVGYLEQIPDYEENISLMDSVMEMYSDIFALRDELRKLEKKMGQDGVNLDKIMQNYSDLSQKYEEMGGYSCEATARRIIKGLGFTDNDYTRDINKFSGGEKTRVSLARLLVREPDLLLLDEPTNHLDIEALEWLEGFLKNYSGAVLLISHDRYFLDAIVTKVYELSNQKIRSFPGNYSRYLILKEEQDLAQNKAFEKQQQKIAQTEEYIRKYKAGIKSKQARGRQKHLERLERIEGIQNEQSINLNFKDIGSTGEIVLKVNEIEMGFAEKSLFDDISFEMRKGDKVALIGANGTGKTTILKIIMGKLNPLKGSIDYGSRVSIGYFDQEHKDLHEEKQVIQELCDAFNMGEKEARNKLATILFQGDDVFKLVRDLSGGEKGRLALLKIILQSPNLLIMDEPTNHLDIPSKEIIENILVDFPGSLLVISHDRYFLDKVTNKTFELEKGSLKEYLGSYSYFKEKKLQLSEQAQKQELNKEIITKKIVKDQKPKINKSKIKEEIKIIEEKITEVEAEIKALGEKLADPESYQNEEKSKELVNDYKEAEENLPVLMARWEELLEILEESI
ncbi:ATP-binding cassette domain-containing protein [Desulfonispora thiosulfatigenes]|nr:ABC-F family ATP-binding cassette domain-containing protein [Desulfonispora thiosulfatigenes]